MAEQQPSLRPRAPLARSQSLRPVMPPPTLIPAARSLTLASSPSSAYDFEAPAPLLECFHSVHHPDLNAIRPTTLLSLLRTRHIAFIIVDCRYPYEFDGGHIISARNIFTEEKLDEFFMSVPSHNGHNVAIIFHCEFSMNRGPSMMKYLRKRDRECSTYPNLLYPHLYLLEGGFKNFYETNSQFNDAFEGGHPTYVPMSEPRFRDQMVFYHSACHSKKREQRLQRTVSCRAVVDLRRPPPPNACLQFDDPTASPA